MQGVQVKTFLYLQRNGAFLYGGAKLTVSKHVLL